MTLLNETKALSIVPQTLRLNTIKRNNPGNNGWINIQYLGYKTYKLHISNNLAWSDPNESRNE